MRRIEDIRPAKQKVKSRIIEEPQEIINSAEEFLAEVTSMPIVEPEITPSDLRTFKMSGRLIGQFIFGILVFIAISVFCYISVVEAKHKINKNFISLSSGFSEFSDSISSRDLSALASGIAEMDKKTTESLLLLQATGQDIYSLNLLYPKKQASKVTMSVDMLRSAHLLTASFDKVTSRGRSNKAVAADNSYLAALNNYLYEIENYFETLPENLDYAIYSSSQAKVLTDSFDAQKFSGAELSAAQNLSKLSNLSSGFFSYFSELSNDLKSELAINGKKSYLILFLNNTELRFGGGFIGSFAKLDLENGKATKLDFEKNIYNLDTAYLAAGNKKPLPPEFGGTFLTMRDSNFSPDFAESSKNVMDMYQKESGNKVDGVFALDTTFFRDLLKVSGPIAMPEYGLTISDKNFLSDVQYQVEIAYFQDKSNKTENQPKKILADMMPKLIHSLTDNSKAEKRLAKEISKAIGEKHLMFYFNNQKVEELIGGVNAGGAIHDGSGDYLYVANANIGGKKSSLNIAEKITQEVEIKADGSVSEKLEILRKHNGSYEWPDDVNRNFVKLYLPLTAKINSITSTDPSYLGPGASTKASVSNGKSIVSYWQTTAPGETSGAKILYSREIKISGDNFVYPIEIQKQPGVESFEWDLKLTFPEGYKPENVEGYDAVNRVLHLSEVIRGDSVFTLRFIRD